MNSKQKLELRANRYGKRKVAYGPWHVWSHYATGYEDGYRAAMRDLRKRVGRAARNMGHIKDPFKRTHMRYEFIAVETQRFLRPLR